MAPVPASAETCVIRSNCMGMARPSGRGWSRRVFLASLSALRLPAASENGTTFPPEFQRYADPATEFTVTRLTDPEHASYLPHHYCRFVSKKFLVFYGERGGSVQAFQMDLKNGEIRQMTQESELDGKSLNLFPDERTLFYVAGRTLYRLNMGNLRTQSLYEIERGYDRGEGCCISPDGRWVFFVEKRPGRSRIRRLDLRRRRRVSTLVQSGGVLSDPVPSPKRQGLLYRGADNSLWVANTDGKNPRRVETPPGEVGPARWTPDGTSVLYLHQPADPHRLTALREYFTDTRQDRFVAKTSRFVSFGVNRDGSVFVGASGNKASPYVLLLVRVGGRELTLCEHRASDPALVSPVFSPDSRKIFFQSDRDGKPAIYSMAVEQLVEATDDSET